MALGDLEGSSEVWDTRGAMRTIQMPDRLGMALVASLRDSEPSTFEEPSQHHVWQDAMMDEYHSIMKNDVWEIVPRPVGKSVATSCWLYKLKHAADGSVKKYKARFVVQGFSQVEGVDYDETFAPAASLFIHQISDIYCCRDGLGDPPDGCEDCISQWSSAGGGIFRAATGI